MDDKSFSFLPSTTELLVASFSASGERTHMNPAWRSVFGRGDYVWERLSREDQLTAEDCIRRVQSGDLITHQLFPVDVPGHDQPLPILLNFVPVITSPQQAAQCAVAVTGEILAEPASWTPSQNQRHRLEALGRMTMGIAHDFNNLLTGILGHTELLKSQSNQPVPYQKIEDHLDTIEKAALDGAALVRKIQQYVRQEIRTEYELVDLPSLVQDAVSLTRPYWYNEPRRQGISIDVALALREVPALLGSPAELRDVLVNLILNAVQAMPNGGTITVDVSHAPLTGVQLSIADTGVGMTEQVKLRIFEPLFTTKGDRGTGMGLAVSKGIVREHEGTITVATKLGAGTVFTLQFPPADVRKATPDEPPSPVPSAELRILLVDDEPMVRSVHGRLLALKGHRVTEASSGPDALAYIEKNDFDLVITDQGMPEMSGRMLAVELRKRHPHLPIVLLTGDTEIGQPDAHVDAILQKPIPLDQLTQAIHDVVSPA